MNNNMDSLYLAKRAVQRKRYGKRIAEARQRRHQFIPVQSVADEMNIKKTKLIAYCIVNNILLENDRRSGTIRVDRTALDRALRDPGRSLSDFELPEDEAIRSLRKNELTESERQKIIFLSDCKVEIR
ncbi:MAG: hypothetical protein IKQ27_14305 [Lachnospiraceae bacterium]|nr:hypothetical protein [Lachnospiraceae bacterium]